MISIVMPALNEASMLEASVGDVVDGMRGLGLSFEVQIVENGSTDGTPRSRRAWPSRSPR